MRCVLVLGLCVALGCVEARGLPAEYVEDWCLPKLELSCRYGFTAPAYPTVEDCVDSNAPACDPQDWICLPEPSVQEVDRCLAALEGFYIDDRPYPEEACRRVDDCRE